MILSVLIPAFNCEDTIKTSLETTLSRLPKKSEVLVYVDGPNDNILAILEEFSDPRLKYIQGETHAGVIASRNILLAASKGEFVANLDADDIVIGRRFCKQLKYIQKTNHDIVFMNCIRFQESKKLVTFKPNLPFRIASNQARHALLHCNPFVNSTMLARRETLHSLGGYINRPEDYDLWNRAAIDGLKMSRQRNYGVLYRVHPKQLTQNKKWQESLKGDTGFSSVRNSMYSIFSIRTDRPPSTQQPCNLCPTEKITLLIEIFGIREALRLKLEFLSQGKI